jgi:membrane protease YdiL (CAAX protease family)
VTGSFSRLLAAGIVSECALLAAAFGIGWLTGVAPFARSRPALDAVGFGIAASVPLLAFLGWCLRTSWPPMRRLVALVEEQIGPHLVGASAGGIALLSLLAGIGEEALFRGVIQAGLAERLPELLSVGIAAVLFGVGHWVSRSYAVLAGAIGVYLGLLFLLTGNLLAPIVTHTLYDVAALSVLARRRPAASDGVQPPG